MFEIQKDIPLSTSRRTKDLEGFIEKLIVTFENMSIGDSFYIPFAELKKTTLQGRLKIAIRVANESERINPSFNVKTKIEGDGVRVWRNIEKAEDQVNNINKHLTNNNYGS